MRVGGTNVDETGVSVGGATGDADGIVELALEVPFVFQLLGICSSRNQAEATKEVEAEEGEAPHPRS